MSQDERDQHRLEREFGLKSDSFGEDDVDEAEQPEQPKHND